MAPITRWEGVAIIGARPLAIALVWPLHSLQKILRPALFSTFQCWREIHLLLGPLTTHSSFLFSGITSLLHKRKARHREKNTKRTFSKSPFNDAFAVFSCCPFRSLPLTSLPFCYCCPFLPLPLTSLTFLLLPIPISPLIASCCLLPVVTFLSQLLPQSF